MLQHGHKHGWSIHTVRQFDKRQMAIVRVYDSSRAWLSVPLLAQVWFAGLNIFPVVNNGLVDWFKLAISK